MPHLCMVPTVRARRGRPFFNHVRSASNLLYLTPCCSHTHTHTHTLPLFQLKRNGFLTPAQTAANENFVNGTFNGAWWLKFELSKEGVACGGGSVDVDPLTVANVTSVPWCTLIPTLKNVYAPVQFTCDDPCPAVDASNPQGGVKFMCTSQVCEVDATQLEAGVEIVGASCAAVGDAIIFRCAEGWKPVGASASSNSQQVTRTCLVLGDQEKCDDAPPVERPSFVQPMLDPTKSLTCVKDSGGGTTAGSSPASATNAACGADLMSQCQPAAVCFASPGGCSAGGEREWTGAYEGCVANQADACGVCYPESACGVKPKPTAVTPPNPCSDSLRAQCKAASVCFASPGGCSTSGEREWTGAYAGCVANQADACGVCYPGSACGTKG